ncbi:MAG TPA: hypothetical protein VM695_12625 [Phycisphaerae bacterium]|nr:hypothetical protein [Phycisphaerae bacterium]
MDTKKGLDLAAGRLSQRPAAGRNGRPKKATSYGKERLGITAINESAEAPEPPATAPAPDLLKPPAAAIIDLCEESPSPPLQLGRAPSAAVRTSLTNLGRLAANRTRAEASRRPAKESRLPPWLLRYMDRPKWWVAPAGGLGILVLLAWVCLSGGDGTTATAPRTAQAAPTPPAISAAPGSPPGRPGPQPSRVVVVPSRPGRGPQAGFVRTDADNDAPWRPAPPAAVDDPFDQASPPPQTTQPAKPKPNPFYPWIEVARRLQESRPHRPATLPAAEPQDPPTPAGNAAPRPREVRLPPRPPKAATPAKVAPATKPAPAAPAEPASKPAAPGYVPCPSGFWFTGVVQQPTGLFANINDRFVKVGGVVNGAKVIRIDKSSVEMEREGMRFFVSFGTGKSGPPAAEDQDDDRPSTEADDDERPEDAKGDEKGGKKRPKDPDSQRARSDE